MADNKPLPVAGYTNQPDSNIALVNDNKKLEERVLRQIDDMATIAHFDQRFVALARTNIQQGFMWMNRAVFQPKRLEGDLD